MVILENLLLSASFLIFVQWAMRIGLPRHAFSTCESFVLGHWPFLFLNLLILFSTGGYKWTLLESFDSETMTIAQWVVALGLLSFLVGGLVAVTPRPIRATTFLRLEAKSTTVLRVGIFLAGVGLAATIPNIVAMSLEGPAARSTVLLGLSELLAPGVLLCYVVARDRHLRTPARFFAGALSLIGIVALSFNWSRRPILVVVGGILALYFVRRRGYFDRRILAVTGPVLLLLGVLAMLWRNVFVYDQEIYLLMDAGVVRYYLDLLWLEASAFSALMMTVEMNGLLEVSGGGSLLLPFIFWIPRSIFPAKPAGYDLGAILGTPYNIGPSIYGEALVNVTIFGLVPFMFFLGFSFKLLDVAVSRRRLSGSGAALYVLLLWDTIFLVRGGFPTMFTPILIHLFIPLALFELDRRLVQRPAFRNLSATESK